MIPDSAAFGKAVRLQAVMCIPPDAQPLLHPVERYDLIEIRVGSLPAIELRTSPRRGTATLPDGSAGRDELHFPPRRGVGTPTDLSTPMEHDMPRKMKTPDIERTS